MQSEQPLNQTNPSIKPEDYASLLSNPVENENAAEALLDDASVEMLDLL